jgi:hypothetical protein
MYLYSLQIKGDSQQQQKIEIMCGRVARVFLQDVCSLTARLRVLHFDWISQDIYSFQKLNSYLSIIIDMSMNSFITDGKAVFNSRLHSP